MDHVLVVHGLTDRFDPEYEIEHPEDCALNEVTSEDGHPGYVMYACTVGQLEGDHGLDFLRWRDLLPGRYTLRSWGIGGSWDAGLVIVREDGLSISACPCHPVQLSEITGFRS